MSDLLHDALNRHAAQQAASDLASLSLNSPPLGAQSGSDLVPVQTPAGSSLPSPASSTASSRASSPSRSSSSGRKGKGGGRPPRDKAAERAKAEAAKRDPLHRFGPTLTARIFALLDVGDLVRCQRVSKKWRRSQTINYTWYRLVQRDSFVNGEQAAQVGAPLVDETGSLTWPRADSLVDWAQKYAELHKPEQEEDEDSYESSSGEERDEDGLTKKERHSLRWADENDATQNMTKQEARAYYKSLGNSKIKGKYGKGSEKTWTVDEPSFGAVDPI